MNKKLLAVASAILLAIGGLIGGAVQRSIFEIPSEQIRQNDRLENLERRVDALEEIARTNSEARIRADEHFKVIERQHQEMMSELQILRDLLAKHERETRRSAHQ